MKIEVLMAGAAIMIILAFLTNIDSMASGTCVLLTLAVAVHLKD